MQWSMDTCSAAPLLSRPYHELSTASHPHSEVKPRRARIVQTWGTRLEVLVRRFLFFFVTTTMVLTVRLIFLPPMVRACTRVLLRVHKWARPFGGQFSIAL